MLSKQSQGYCKDQALFVLAIHRSRNKESHANARSRQHAVRSRLSSEMRQISKIMNLIPKLTSKSSYFRRQRKWKRELTPR